MHEHKWHKWIAHNIPSPMTPLQNKLTQRLMDNGHLKNGAHAHFLQNSPIRIDHSAKTIGRIGLKLKYLRF